MTDTMRGPWDAEYLMRLLTGNDQISPTDEQRRVIEYPGDAPALVVAGAGSGKTETMANRVVWMVANGRLRPSEVLGLTFTRKAAKELRERVRRALAKLRAAGIVDYDPDLEAPTVTTYNSFANTIYRDYALRIGREPDAEILTEAGAWALAHEVVTASDDPTLPGLDKTVTTVTDLVLTVSRAMRAHRVTPQQILAFVADFERVARLPYSKVGDSADKVYADIKSAIKNVTAFRTLLPLREAYERRKRALGLVEFADQEAFALDIVERIPQVAQDYRARYAAVLLDEYQDTSVIQTSLLSGLFRGAPVMAVGDPNQSIYGWRGASAGNLAGFDAAFGPATHFTLTTSWRNDRQILAAANLLSRPFRQGTTGDVARTVGVPTLAPSGFAGEGTVEYVQASTVPEEAQRVAEWFRDRLEAASPSRPTAAVLVRKRSALRTFEKALREAGVPCVVVGLGGVLESPEITDLRAALMVCVDPDAGNELLRLLAGPRWRLGVGDLAALRELAGTLVRRGKKSHEDDGPELAAEEAPSIVEALDAIGWRSEAAYPGLSETGYARLKDAAEFFQELRTHTAMPLVDYVEYVADRLELADDLIAKGGQAPLRNLHAFQERVQQYAASGLGARGSGVAGFLGWLDQLAEREQVEAERVEAEPGTVQLLTIHAAKGLEWDLVAIPRLVDGELPAKPQGTKAWVGASGDLPYELRGDRLDLPHLPWREAECQKDIKTELAAAKGDDALPTFVDQEKARQLAEERRIAYVAVTRAKHHLLLTASPYQAGRTGAAKPSPFLEELARAAEAENAGTATPGDKQTSEGAKPLHTTIDLSAWPSGDAQDAPEFPPQPYDWPRDPLGARRHALEQLAREVTEAMRGQAERPAAERRGEPSADGADAWVDWLLAERRLHLEGSDRPKPVLPARVAASALHEFLTDPEGTAERLVRPMPEQPYTATRVGTLFHAWLEHRYGQVGVGEHVDAELFELDAEADVEAPVTARDREALTELQERFERSAWASLTPEYVEIPAQLPLGGVTVSCKLDAVFRTGSGYRVVDWKTGKAPKTTKARREREIQLSLYRLAFAQTHGIDPERVTAALYYVRDDVTLEVERPLGATQLEQAWRLLADGD